MAQCREPSHVCSPLFDLWGQLLGEYYLKEEKMCNEGVSVEQEMEGGREREGGKGRWEGEQRGQEKWEGKRREGKERERKKEKPVWLFLSVQSRGGYRRR